MDKKINTATRTYEKLKYNDFIRKLKPLNIIINRKILAKIAEFDKNCLLKIINN